MGEAVAAAVASKVVGSILEKKLAGNPNKAQARESARLTSEAAALKAETEAKRKAKALQRPQTNVFGTPVQTEMSGALGA